MKRIVTGILAHVDSGKTTLSEALLFKCGEIRKLGRVDHKNAFLDTNSIERERGITIFAKQAVFHLNNSEYTLLDTPGHVDFSAETERTFQVLDYAILVISAPEGIQSHTETLWNLLKRYNVPVFIFLNKTDISDRSSYDVICELRAKLSEGCVDFSHDINLPETAEHIAMQDEELMEKFIENESLSEKDIIEAIKSRKVFPCLFGSALKLDGIDKFLDVFDKYTKAPDYKNDFGARVFKIEDEKGKRLTFMKITGGLLKVRDSIIQNTSGEQKCEKISRIRIYSGEKFTAVQEAPMGCVCAVEGLTFTYPGEGLGSESDSILPLLEPVLSYNVILPPGTDSSLALKNIKKLEEEDPQLRVSWNNRSGHINIHLMGEIQLEVIKKIILERFALDVNFDRGSISYRETISSPIEGAGHFEPLRHYAEVHLLLEPARRGSGLQFFSNCSTDMLDLSWQRLILTHLAEKNHAGVLCGFPITDIKITLTAGKAHLKHTEGGDFRQATYRAVRQALMKAENVLLEPWYNFILSVPNECVGRALSDLDKMSAVFSPPSSQGESSVIEGRIPASEIINYHTVLASYSGGRGSLRTVLSGYDVCHNANEVIQAIGYDCESDVENTADSVFCAHGAGYNVKWNEADSLMHVSSGISFKESTSVSEEQKRRAEEYVGSIEQDKELLAIFERTYGPIKRRSTDFFRTKKIPTDNKPYKAKNVLSGEEYLLVDGYNIIFSWDDLHEYAKKDLSLARSTLENRLSNFAAFKNCRLILVFDAYKVHGGRGSVEKVNNIDVVYTKEAETADMYIEKVSHTLTKNHKVRVATSDGLEQIIILGGGAIRVTSEELLEEVKASERAIREYLNDINN